MSVQNNTNNLNNNTIETQNEFPEELICAIQLHFNKKIPVELIKQILQKNNNDLFVSLKYIYQQLQTDFIEE